MCSSMSHCSVFGCVSHSGRGGASLYRLPKNDKLSKQWTHFCKNANLPKKNSIRICHLHFTEDCFERDLKVKYFAYTYFYFESFCNYTPLFYCYKKIPFQRMSHSFQKTLLGQRFVRSTDFSNPCLPFSSENKQTKTFAAIEI